MTNDQKHISRLPVLCIEDDADTCNLIEFIFAEAGWKIETCERLECLSKVRENAYAAVILDNYFGEMSGVEICAEIRKFDRRLPIIIFSGESRSLEMSKALEAGADDYLIKPQDLDRLLPRVTELIQKTS